MRVILHIGMSKTGTSALQRALRLAAADPATWPLAYPTWPDDAPSHHELAGLYLHDRYLPRVLTDAGRRSLAEAGERGERAWSAIADAARTSELVVISSELLFAIDDEAVADLAARLAGIGAEVELACYVRPPAAHYVASLSQRVRASREALRPTDHRMQLGVRLGRWGDAFPGRVTVRAYDRERLVGGDLIEDFRATFLPELPPLPRPPDREANSSLSKEGIALVHAMRSFAWPDDEGDVTKSGQVVLEQLGRLDDAPSASARDLVPGLADAITWSHDVDLAMLEERFGVALADRVPAPAVPCPAWTSDDPAEILDLDEERLERLRWRLVRATADQVLTVRSRVARLEARLAEANERRRVAEAARRDAERQAPTVGG